MNRSCELMHGERRVAAIHPDGSCKIYCPQFMPYNLRLEETEDGDPGTRTNNLTRFFYWCATRPLTLPRAAAGDFLLSHGLNRASTDSERAEIALACHGLCLLDPFWIREEAEAVSYARINLFDHPSAGEYTDVVLRDHGMIAKNVGLILCNDSEGKLSAQAAMPNVWIRRNGKFWLIKNGSPRDVEAELVSSRIARCFDLAQVLYEPTDDHGRKAARCELLTTRKKSIVFAADIMFHTAGTGGSLWDLVRSNDERGFHMMNIIDYLIGNTDRNVRNWGFWLDNADYMPGKLFPLMDFNRSFRSYDTLDGAKCLTVRENMSQRAAAVLGVRKIGFNQIRSLPENLPALFADLNTLAQARLDEMFRARLDVLRRNTDSA